MVEATPSKAVRTRRAESIRAQIEFLSRPDVRLGGMGNPKTPTLDARDSCLFHGVRGKGKRGKRDWPRRGVGGLRFEESSPFTTHDADIWSIIDRDCWDCGGGGLSRSRFHPSPLIPTRQFFWLLANLALRRRQRKGNPAT